jgi:hypothetical protein
MSQGLKLVGAIVKVMMETIVAGVQGPTALGLTDQMNLVKVHAPGPSMVTTTTMMRIIGPKAR